MSIEIRQGYDLKLRRRSSRYRVVCFGPSLERGVNEDELIVHRHHPRTMRPQGRQIKVKLRDVEALCTGLAWDRSGPLWQNISGWITLPRMPERRYAKIAPHSAKQRRLQAEANIAHDLEA